MKAVDTAQVSRAVYCICFPCLRLEQPLHNFLTGPCVLMLTPSTTLPLRCSLLQPSQFLGWIIGSSHVKRIPCIQLFDCMESSTWNAGSCDDQASLCACVPCCSVQVYVQPALLGWRPVLLSWLNTLPSPGITATHKAHITQLFDWLVPPMLRVALKQVWDICLMCAIVHMHAGACGHMQMN